MRLKPQQSGAIDPLVIPLVISVIMIVGLAGFSLWAFVSYSDQKSNVDMKVAEAVAAAEVQKEAELEAVFIEKEKEPLVSFQGNNTVGSVTLSYPKTWSGYVDERSSGSTPLDTYFHPDFVPAKDSKFLYALRLKVIEKDYSKEVESYQSKVEKGTLRAKPIKISGQIGTRLDGEVDTGKEGAIVLLPLRDKTIQIWTESKTYLNDFTNIVIPSVTYEP